MECRGGLLGAEFWSGEDVLGARRLPSESRELDEGRFFKRLICWKTSVALCGSGRVADEGETSWHSGWFPKGLSLTVAREFDGDSQATILFRPLRAAVKSLLRAGQSEWGGLKWRRSERRD